MPAFGEVGVRPLLAIAHYLRQRARDVAGVQVSAAVDKGQ